MKIIHGVYDKLISLDNIFISWDEFKKGKMSKQDVMEFERHLEDNIFQLHEELKNGTYQHGSYSSFPIWDPKHRVINKAIVKDRLVHHLVYRELYQIFDPTFIYHSYSSRIGKGTHLAVKNLARALRKVSRNYTGPVYVLKCDIKKFFPSIPHKKLLQIVENKIEDSHFLWLVEEIVESFLVPSDPATGLTSSRRTSSERRERERERVKRGLPIGNVTSQVFANIYLNELDQFIKQQLKVKHYFRYADDFVVVHHDPSYLERNLQLTSSFLNDELYLDLHPGKVEIRKFKQGIDFLGYIILPHYIIPRTKTKRRMLRKLLEKQNQLCEGQIDKESFNQTLQSYLGILCHCDAHDLQNVIKNNFL